MNDDELRSMLKTWQAPAAPAELRCRVFAPPRLSWRWLFSGEIRVPIPLAVAFAAVLLFIAYRVAQPPSASLSDFRQVQQFQPRVVKSSYEND
ncbi:MAG: hypothetical protein K2X03_08200 [Bryobacteraceae bacterium]|nr:hypothetical protein [Bryobacteraceae bacterium]